MCVCFGGVLEGLLFLLFAFWGLELEGGEVLVFLKKKRNKESYCERDCRTMLPVANFFSVPTMAPVRWAWLSAPFPRTTVSRWEGPPLTLLPILVTVSQSDIFTEKDRRYVELEK